MEDYITLHTPHAHKDHNDGGTCDCCEDVTRAAFACKCGACYGPGVYSFSHFYCYDCGAKLRLNYLNEYLGPQPYSLGWWLDILHEAVFYTPTKHLTKESMEKDFAFLDWIKQRIIKKYGQ